LGEKHMDLKGDTLDTVLEFMGDPWYSEKK
jgi:hypothetical protein